MSNTAFDDAKVRNGILQLLSDAEVAKVSNTEDKAAVSAGDTYIDLENLEAGVQEAKSGTAVASARIIQKSALSAETWNKIVAKLQH